MQRLARDITHLLKHGGRIQLAELVFLKHAVVRTKGVLKHGGVAKWGQAFTGDNIAMDGAAEKTFEENLRTQRSILDRTTGLKMDDTLLSVGYAHTLGAILRKVVRRQREKPMRQVQGYGPWRGPHARHHSRGCQR